MRYKNYLQGTTQEQRFKIEKLKAIIKEQTGLDINKVSRKREVINARKAYYKLLHLTTKISYTTMAKSVGKTHATVLHALRHFDFDYNTDNEFKELYDNLFTVYVDGKEIDTTDKLVYENLKLQENIRMLNSELEELRSELKKARSNNIRPRNQQTKIYNASETIVAF
jgi:dynactin complex subunit